MKEDDEGEGEEFKLISASIRNRLIDRSIDWSYRPYTLKSNQSYSLSRSFVRSLVGSFVYLTWLAFVWVFLAARSKQINSNCRLDFFFFFSPRYSTSSLICLFICHRASLVAISAGVIEYLDDGETQEWGMLSPPSLPVLDNDLTPQFIYLSQGLKLGTTVAKWMLNIVYYMPEE